MTDPQPIWPTLLQPLTDDEAREIFSKAREKQITAAVSFAFTHASRKVIAMRPNQHTPGWDFECAPI